jgi:zinc protease
MIPATERVLENGLKVIVLESHATPNVCCSIWYRAGSKHETAGATGLAHLLEHMMFKGTRRFPKGEFDRILHRNGAINNASTWLDRTNYYELIKADRLDIVLELEADRMRGALFQHSDLEDEMPVVRNELERDEDDPESNLFHRIQSLAFLEHPYHWPTIGWKADVEAIRAEQIRRFYDTFYHPNNAFLVIVGDVDTEETFRLVEKHFGRIPPGPEPPKVVTVEPPQKGERRVVIRKPGENDYLGMAFRIPQRRHPDNYALDLLGQILGQGRTSRLYKALVERKLAVRTTAVNYATLEDPFLFFLEAEVAPEVEPRLVEEAVEETLARLRDEPVEPRELERAKKRNRVEFVYRRDRVSRQAFFLGELEVSCGWRFGQTYLEAMERVSVEDIQRVARTYLVADSRTVGWYLAVRDGETASGENVQETREPAEVRGVQARSGGEVPGIVVRKGAAARTHREVLENGIRVLARPNRANQTVELVGRLEGGMLLEGETLGISHATARMLDRGTRRRTRAEIAEILEGLGATISFRSTVEVLGFHAKCLREDAETVLSLLAEMLLEPAFPPEEWEIARRQILGAIRDSRQETFDRAYYRAMELLCGAGNVYARLPMGSEESLERLAPEDLAAFHEKMIAGSRLAVAVVGDLEAGDAVRLVATRLGRMEPGTPLDTRAEAGRWTEGLEPEGVVEEHVEMPEKSQVDLVFARPGLSRDDPAWEAAFVANYILGGHFSSRLNKQLRDNEGLTYGTYSRLRAGLGKVPWYATIGVHPENVRRARDGVLREMRRLRDGGVEASEFEDAILHLTGSYPVRLETNEAVANMLLDGERYGLGPDVIETYEERLRSVKKEEVEEQARRLFVPERIVVVSAGTLGG